MRLLILSTAALVVWQGFARTKADDFAAVPGTGWTDISQLSSTCDITGYFVNSADCSRFYVCVDHSTPDHRLLLRYDFDCPGGLAFDQFKKICDYPGPSGCISNSGGGSSGGWPESSRPPSSGGGGWPESSKPPSNGGGWGGWSSKAPSWGTPVGGGGVVRVTSTSNGYPANPRVNVGVPGADWESLRIQPLNHGGVFRRVKITQAPHPGSGLGTDPENSGVFDSARLTQKPPNSVAWGTSKVFPVNPGVFESSRVTQVPKGEWAVPKEFPAPPQNVFGNARVVEGHSGSWQSDRGGSAPANPAIRWDNRIQAPAGGWEAVRVTTPSPWEGIRASPSPPTRLSPTPPPANWVRVTPVPRWEVSPSPVTPQSVPSNPLVGTPRGPWEGIRAQSPPQNQGVSWEGIRVSQSPPPRVSSPAHPSGGWEAVRVTSPQGPTPPPSQGVSWEGIRASPSPPPSWERVVSPSPAPSNPSSGGGWEVRVSQGPPPPQSPQVWQNVRTESGSGWGPPDAGNPSFILQRGQGPAAANPGLTLPNQQNVRITQTQIPSGFSWQTTPVVSTEAVPVETPSPGQGNFGIIQQVLDEQRRQQGEAGKSHIQQIYENQEKQNANNAAAAAIISQSQSQSQSATGVDLTNPLYQIIASRNSGSKGRIIVLYAPLKGITGKRDVPVVHVEVGDVDDSGESAENQENQ